MAGSSWAIGLKNAQKGLKGFIGLILLKTATILRESLAKQGENWLNEPILLWPSNAI